MAKIRLTVLGDVELRTGDGDLVGSVLNQPRRLALLIYLAVESRGAGVQRDRLLGLFWPELPQDHARQALRTALHFLRRSLGSAALTGDGGAVGIDPDTLACDAAEFRALRENDPADALQLYRGDLLPGFYLDDGPPEFERWLEETRISLRREAADAAWALTGEHEAAGNAPGAGAWARRAAQLSEGDEAAVRRAIDLLGRIGDRAGALAAYEELARRLRNDFGAEPSPATRAAVEHARRDLAVAGGARHATMDAASSAEGGVGVHAASGAAPPADSGRDPRSVPGGAPPPAGWRAAVRRASRGIYSVTVTLLLMAGFYSLWGLGRGEAGSAVGVRMVPVLQLEEMRDYSGDGLATDLAGALTLEITSRLSGIQSLQVVPVGQSQPTAGSAHPTYVVRGGLLRSDSIVRVTAMLLDGASGATLERITAERPFAGSAETTAELADLLARGIRREVGRAVEDRERSATSRNPRALALVRAAVRDIEAGDSLGTTGAFEAALVSFAAADSQLALAQAEAPRWAEPSVQRAELAYRRMWLHLPPPANDVLAAGGALNEGVSHADAALRIAADDPAALELRGLLEYWRWRLRSAGSEAENEAARTRAEADLHRATEIEVGRARAWSVLSALHDNRGDFAAANLAARWAYRTDPYLENAFETVVRLYSTSLEVGDAGAARRWCEELATLAVGSWLPAYCLLEQMAWEGPPPGMDAAAARDFIDATIGRSPGATQTYARLEMLGAVILARAGSAPAALSAIQAAREIGGDEDSHLLALEAWARLTMGEEAAAAALLERAAATDPRGSRPMLESRRFDALRIDGG